VWCVVSGARVGPIIPKYYYVSKDNTLSLLCNVYVISGARVGPIIPKYYYVSKDCVEAEKANPGSQDRLPSDEDGDKGNIYLWGQSVYLISQLLG